MVAGLITVLIVGGVALASGGTMFNPGPLNAMSESGTTIGGAKSHADIGGNCAACHVDPWSSEVMATRCMNCHADIRAQLSDPNSLHSAMPDVMVCRQCHAEHNGANATLTRINFDNFPHERVGFALTSHTKLSNGQLFACADCHGDQVTAFDRALCEECHREYQGDFVTKHAADFGHECLACHDGVDRFSKFDHNVLKFTLSGQHADIACGRCHTNVRAVADFKQASPACADCHLKDDAHNGKFGADCAKCHTSDSWDNAQFDHNLAAFKLTGAHVKVECAKCHVNSVFKGTPQTCVGCHANDDSHTGAFGTDCGQCHNPSSWQDAKFDHNLAAFKLTGAHVNVQCQQCHQNNVFKGTPQACVACHAEPQEHLGAFGTDCAQCHTTATWQGAVFNHTAFPLNHGESGTIACATCHTPPSYRAYTCYGCHEHDPARVQAQHREEGIANLDNCVRCHPGGRREGGEGGRD
jgi:hypothetical protein